jgi:uncharacterized SAM-binding protein YcdF (DUF218 family)
MNGTRVRELGEILWNYLRIGAPLDRREAIVVFGGHDLRVAECGAQLWLDGWAPKLVLSGGLGYYTGKIWAEPEALIFKRIAIERGVAEDAILVEDRSRNTGENAVFTRRFLSGEGIVLRRAICVQNPYMERRVLLTLRKQWPDCDFVMASPPADYERYMSSDIIDFDKLIHVLVGQVDRVERYPRLGFTAPEEVPWHVLAAKAALIELGFGQHLVPDENA